MELSSLQIVWPYSLQIYHVCLTMYVLDGEVSDTLLYLNKVLKSPSYCGQYLGTFPKDIICAQSKTNIIHDVCQVRNMPIILFDMMWLFVL